LEQIKAEPSEASKHFSLKLLKGLFGPNSFTHFSAKKNQDLMGPLCVQLDNDQITEYIESHLTAHFNKPDLKLFYPEESGAAVDGDIHDADDASHGGTLQKRLSVQLFALSQASSIT